MKENLKLYQLGELSMEAREKAYLEWYLENEEETYSSMEYFIEFCTLENVLFTDDGERSDNL